MPAAAASTEPRTKVKLMTKSMFTPISAATDGFQETARIAMPMRVWKTMRWSTIMRASEMTIVTRST